MITRIQLSGLVVGACVLAAPANESAKSSPTREEKVESLLTALTKRCCKMIELQRIVNDGTKQLHRTIATTPKKTANPADLQAAIMLSEFQKTVIAVFSASRETPWHTRTLINLNVVKPNHAGRCFALGLCDNPTSHQIASGPAVA